MILRVVEDRGSRGRGKDGLVAPPLNHKETHVLSNSIDCPGKARDNGNGGGGGDNGGPDPPLFLRPVEGHGSRDYRVDSILPPLTHWLLRGADDRGRFSPSDRRPGVAGRTGKDFNTGTEPRKLSG